jgi:hypothetical protein
MPLGLRQASSQSTGGNFFCGATEEGLGEDFKFFDGRGGYGGGFWDEVLESADRARERCYK